MPNEWLDEEIFNIKIAFRLTSEGGAAWLFKN